MVRILYGGTFDPVHDGHLAVADAASVLLAADVDLLPSADPPHRALPGANALQRAAMLDLAIVGHPRLHVDRRELRREGPSYSFDTLLEVRTEIGPEAPLAWLLGADAFHDLATWYRWRELFDLAHLVVAVRPGHPMDPLVPALQLEVAARWTDDPVLLETTANGLLLLLDLPLRFEAANKVRARIAAGSPWEDEVPPAVAAYIHAQRLYGATGSGG